MTKETLVTLRDIVIDKDLLGTAVGLNPWVAPGTETAHKMVDSLKALTEKNPDLLK